MPASRPNIRDIPWRRWAAYSVVSLLSGVGWAGISLMLYGMNNAPYLLLNGAVTGLLVGWAMNWFYRSPSWLPTLLSTPLAYYLGVFFYLLLGGLWNPHASLTLIPTAAVFALFVFAPPFVALMFLAWFNGLALRWILLGFPQVKD